MASSNPILRYLGPTAKEQYSDGTDAGDMYLADVINQDNQTSTTNNG